MIKIDSTIVPLQFSARPSAVKLDFRSFRFFIPFFLSLSLDCSHVYESTEQALLLSLSLCSLLSPSPSLCPSLLHLPFFNLLPSIFSSLVLHSTALYVLPPQHHHHHCAAQCPSSMSLSRCSLYSVVFFPHVHALSLLHFLPSPTPDSLLTPPPAAVL